MPDNLQIIIIGGSAGSLQVILKIISGLKPNHRTPLLVVVHRKAAAKSVLRDVIASKTKLAVKEIEDKEPIREKTIYIAPADYHTLIENEKIFALDYSEKVHFTRPSIDVTFTSAAEVFGNKTMAVVLSGANADGAEGLADIIEAGGVGLVQDPSTAEVPIMPQAALSIAGAKKCTADEVIEIVNGS